jgi:hypothetical protein
VERPSEIIHFPTRAAPKWQRCTSKSCYDQAQRIVRSPNQKREAGAATNPDICEQICGTPYTSHTTKRPMLAARRRALLLLNSARSLGRPADSRRGRAAARLATPGSHAGAVGSTYCRQAHERAPVVQVGRGAGSLSIGLSCRIQATRWAAAHN